MTKFKESDLIEDKDLRKQLGNKVKVLSKVKELITLPDTELLTTRLIAEYYNVSQDVIRDNVRRHKEELLENGMKLTSYNEIKQILNSENISHLNISRQGTNLFSLRAVLNLGMLLRDSEVAKEVRNQLLNGFEQLSNEQKVNSVERGVHPTQKPVDLIEYLIKTYSNEGETVLDNCIGSGTTAIACINTKRNWIGIEMEEEYVKIANERIEKNTIQ